MTRIINTQPANLDKDFYRFQARIIQSRRQNNTYFVSQLSRYQKLYRRAGLENQFAENIYKFAENMANLGIENFPGIIYSALVKMPFLTYKEKEKYALKGLSYAEQQGDYIHINARLVDLGQLYHQMNYHSKYVNVVFRKAKVLEKICDDFKEAEESYKTYNKKHSDLRKYELELAKARIDIAKVVKNTNPIQAKEELKKARVIFERENMQKEIDFVDFLLSEVWKTINTMISPKD